MAPIPPRPLPVVREIALLRESRVRRVLFSNKLSLQAKNTFYYVGSMLDPLQAAAAAALQVARTENKEQNLPKTALLKVRDHGTY